MPFAHLVRMWVYAYFKFLLSSLLVSNYAKIMLKIEIKIRCVRLIQHKHVLMTVYQGSFLTFFTLYSYVCFPIYFHERTLIYLNSLEILALFIKGTSHPDFAPNSDFFKYVYKNNIYCIERIINIWCTSNVFVNKVF